MAKPTVNAPRWQTAAPKWIQGGPSESGEVQAYRGHGLFCSYAQRKSRHQFDPPGEMILDSCTCMVHVLYGTVQEFDPGNLTPICLGGQITPCANSHKNGE